MEQVRDLNMEADDMQVVLSAISGVSKRIKEVAQTHKPLFGGEHFLTGKEVCERLYISPRTLQDYRDRKIIPYTQFAGKILYKVLDLERLLEKNFKKAYRDRIRTIGRHTDDDTQLCQANSRTLYKNGMQDRCHDFYAIYKFYQLSAYRAN